MMSKDEEQKITPKNVLLALLMMFVTVYILQVSYNSVIPGITKQGSLKLGAITWFQALALMIVSNYLMR